MTALPKLDVAAELLAAFNAAFWGDPAATITPSLLRTIGNSYQSCADRRLGVGLDYPPPLRRLRAAMDAFVAVHPESSEALFGPEEVPF